MKTLMIASLFVFVCFAMPSKADFQCESRTDAFGTTHTTCREGVRGIFGWPSSLPSYGLERLAEPPVVRDPPSGPLGTWPYQQAPRDPYGDAYPIFRDPAVMDKWRGYPGVTE